MVFKQADRLPCEDYINISELDENYLRLDLGVRSFAVSRFNAARLFGMLALVLGINLPKVVTKAIKF